GGGGGGAGGAGGGRGGVSGPAGRDRRARLRSLGRSEEAAGAGARADARTEADPARRAHRRRDPGAGRRDRATPGNPQQGRPHLPDHRAPSRRDRAAVRSRRRAGGWTPPRPRLVRRARRRPPRAGGLHGTARGDGVTLLACDGIVAGYSAADTVLKGVDLTIERGEIVSVIGPNGAGKSTLLKVVAGILTPSRGTVTFGDRPIHGRPAREISALGVAFVPQEQNVFPTMTVRENLEIGGYVDPAGARVRIEAILERFPVLYDKRRHAARTLSGGQRQILAMAMALMVEPMLLLLDEPSAGLAPRAAEQLFETIRAINADGV